MTGITPAVVGGHDNDEQDAQAEEAHPGALGPAADAVSRHAAASADDGTVQEAQEALPRPVAAAAAGGCRTRAATGACFGEGGGSSAVAAMAHRRVLARELWARLEVWARGQAGLCVARARDVSQVVRARAREMPQVVRRALGIKADATAGGGGAGLKAWGVRGRAIAQGVNFSVRGGMRRAKEGARRVGWLARECARAKWEYAAAGWNGVRAQYVWVGLRNAWTAHKRGAVAVGAAFLFMLGVAVAGRSQVGKALRVGPVNGVAKGSPGGRAREGRGRGGGATAGAGRGGRSVGVPPNLQDVVGLPEAGRGSSAETKLAKIDPPTSPVGVAEEDGGVFAVLWSIATQMG